MESLPQVLQQNKAWEQKPSRSAKPKVGPLVLGFYMLISLIQPDSASFSLNQPDLG
jgi:hypothetical protein